MQPGQICHVDLRPEVSDGEICQGDMGPEGFQVSCQVHVAMRCNLNSGGTQHWTAVMTAVMTAIVVKVLTSWRALVVIVMTTGVRTVVKS